MDNFKNSIQKKQKNQKNKRKSYKEEFYEKQPTYGILVDKNESNSKNISKDKSFRKDFSSKSSLLLSSEHESMEMKKRKIQEKEGQKRYIVDDIDNIFVLLKEPKLKLHIQEILHYFIVFLICIYYWIFLFITGIKFERNYYLTDYDQFDTCSDEQVCDFPENSANVIIYNNSFNYFNHPSDIKEFFIEECNTVNSFYRQFFVRYSNVVSKKKFTATMQPDYITDKPFLSIVIINKEKWELYFRYFSLCEYENYYFSMVVMVAIGGILGSFIFGFLSDIYGRRIIILITLTISTLSTFGIYFLSLYIDKYHENELHFFQEKCQSEEIICTYDIMPDLFAQNQTKKKFSDLYAYYLICILLLSISLWPLLKSCMALLVENSKGELEVLINFRRYNFVFQGLPPLSASLIFVNVNNFTLTFLILSIINLITLIISFIFLDESIRYYYEYCEWENLTKVLLNTYKINLDDFRTLNKPQLRQFQKIENSKTFKKVDSYTYNNNKNKSYHLLNQTYYKNYVDARSALDRNIKRNIDFIIKLEDIKSYPLLILTSLWANHALKNSKTLLLIILILLYIIMDLFQKELLEPPFFSTKDFYFGIEFNYILNSILFYYLITNVLSNFFYYWLYRLECFKTVIYITQIIVSGILIIYHFLITNVPQTPMDIKQYNLNMLTYFLRDIRQELNLILLFIVYFGLNGVVFYVYLLILKISKTIHRCTLFSLHSAALIIATVISELIYYYMENYFLFLGILNLLCLLTFFFLSEFKDLIYIINDLKVNMFGIRKNNWREKFKIN